MSFLRNTIVFTALSFATFVNGQTPAPESQQTTATYGSWSLECAIAKDKKEECIIFHTAKEPKEGNFEMLRVTVGKFGKDKIGIIISAPLGVELIPGIDIKLLATEKDNKGTNLQVLMKDADGKEKRQDIEGLSYERCMETSCISGFPIDQIEINRLKKAKSLSITIAGPSANDKTTVSVPLLGFSAAIDIMMSKK